MNNRENDRISDEKTEFDRSMTFDNPVFDILTKQMSQICPYDGPWMITWVCGLLNKRFHQNRAQESGFSIHFWLMKRLFSLKWTFLKAKMHIYSVWYTKLYLNFANISIQALYEYLQNGSLKWFHSKSRISWKMTNSK